jgi:hypothetical protein
MKGASTDRERELMKCLSWAQRHIHSVSCESHACVGICTDIDAVLDYHEGRFGFDGKPFIAAKIVDCMGAESREAQQVNDGSPSTREGQVAPERLEIQQPSPVSEPAVELKQNYCHCNGQAAHLHRDEAETTELVTIECCHVCDTPKVHGNYWKKCPNEACPAFDASVASASYRKVAKPDFLACASCGDSTRSVKYRLREDKNLCSACFSEHSSRDSDR